MTTPYRIPSTRTVCVEGRLLIEPARELGGSDPEHPTLEVEVSFKIAHNAVVSMIQMTKDEAYMLAHRLIKPFDDAGCFKDDK